MHSGETCLLVLFGLFFTVERLRMLLWGLHGDSRKEDSGEKES